jgi:hypothetical protein
MGSQTKLSNIQDHIVTKSVFLSFIRKVLCEKSTLAIFALVLVAEGILNDGSLLKIIPIGLGWLLLVALGITTWALFYVAFAQVIWLAAIRNIPMILSGIMFCLLVSVLLVALFVVLLGHIQPVERIIVELSKTFVLMMLGLIIVLSIHQDAIDQELIFDNFGFPVWRPINKNMFEHHVEMPPALRKDILFIQSANQYIEVHTPDGKHDLRMSLTKAETFLDTSIGTRVHRSHWVKNSEMKHLTYQNGNPFIELYIGSSLPVGRNMVETVKAHISNNV